MSTQQAIVEMAAATHKAHWKVGGSVSEQTKSAQHVTREWQAAVKEMFPNRFSAELSVGGDCKESIDLVDLERSVGYELKSSGNNALHEFYRDIFKVAIFNMNHPSGPLKWLVFITESAGADKLGTRFGDLVRILTEKQHGFKVEVCGI